jgi:hypothetical protein
MSSFAVIVASPCFSVLCFVIVGSLSLQSRSLSKNISKYGRSRSNDVANKEKGESRIKQDGFG